MIFLREKRLTALYALFIVIYLLQNLVPAVDAKTLAKYQISATQLKLLGLTVALPYIIIWLISLVGYVRLKQYSRTIASDKDGKAFNTISYGVLGLSLWLPLSTIISNWFTQLYHSHSAWTANLVRLDNYLNLVILFISFWLINKDTTQLLPLIKKSSFVSTQGAIFAYLAFAALYVLLVLHDPARTQPTDAADVATYYLSDWLIVVTLIIPRLFYWFLGLQSVQHLYLYRVKVKGKIYKAALKSFALGIAMVTGVTILLRCLQSIGSLVQEFSLGLILGLVYLLLILLAAGYILIARGAKRLQKLEEL